MKIQYIIPLVFFAFGVLADGPVVQTTPFTRTFLRVNNSTDAQTALGITGATTATVISNTAIAAVQGIPMTNNFMTNGTFQGNFAGNGNSLSSVTALTTLSGNLVADGLYVQNLGGAWSANTFAADVDGQAITTWPDVSGQGNDLKCTSLTFSHNACNGNPGVFFTTYGTSLATNQNFLSRYLINTNVTIFAVVRSLATPHSSQDLVMGLGNSTAGFPPLGSFWWGNYSGPGAPNPQTFMFPPTGGSGGSYDCMNAGQVDVMAMSYNGQFYAAWQNGIQELDGRYSDSQISFPETTGVGSAGDLWVGGRPTGPQYHGYIALLLIYTNCLTATEIQQNNNALCRLYGVPNNVLILAGDSIVWGELGLPMTNMMYFATASFPGWLVANISRPGMGSSNQISYLQDVLPSLNQPSANRVVEFMEEVNDKRSLNASANYTETNYLLAAGLCHSNATKFIASTIPSYQAGDADGTRMTFNTQLLADYHEYADGIVDYSGIPTIYTNGACSNQPTLFNSDFIHPLPAGYMLMSNAEISAVQGVIYR